MKQSGKKQDLLFILFMGIFLTGFSLIFLTSTSPLSTCFYGNDSAFFRFIGSEMLRGKELYTEIWDHKGPILYFIQEIGALHGTRNEKISLIFVIELLMIYLSAFFMYKICAATSKSHHKKILFFLLTVCSLTILGCIWEGGNFSEDWSIPMICCSLYMFAAYALHSGQDPRHPRRYAFLHGICFALIAFIRINNAISICAGAAVIGIYLLSRKLWKNFMENLLFGLLGIAAVTLPLFVRFGLSHTLHEMLYATFFFNLKYSEDASIPLTFQSLVFRFLPIASSLLAELLFLLKNRKIRLIDILSLAIIFANILLFLKINRYDHYFIVYLPVFLFTLILYTDRQNVFSLLVPALVFAYYINHTVNLGRYYLRSGQQPNYATANLYFPKAEKDSAIAINVNPEVYLNTGIRPCSRFVANQRRHFAVNPAFEEEFIKTLQEKKPLWIIGNCSPDGSVPYAEYLPELRYELRFNDSTYCFFRQTEP